MKVAFISILLLITSRSFGQSYSYLKIELLTYGATVYLDKVQIKGVNLSNRLTVASGKHIVSATKDGYFPFQLAFSLAAGEHKTVSVFLEQDQRSSLIISSSSASTNLLINGDRTDWNSSTPLNKLINPGYYKFDFSEYGKISVAQNIEIANNRIYKIKVNLESSYPFLTPSDIGRSVKSKETLNPVDLHPETKKDINTKATIISAVIGAVIAVVAMPNDKIGPSIYLGGGLGLIIGALVFKKQVPDKNAIEYNNNLRKNINITNEGVEKYNNETQQLIKQRQLQLYNKSAISVEEDAQSLPENEKY